MKASWGTYAAAIERAVKKMDDMKFFKRLEERDASLWKTEPEHVAEINQRLGWLDGPQFALENAGRLAAFAAAVSADGYKKAVLLGMGGSSLAPEVLQTIFGVKDGFLEILVLDSTDPRRIREIEERVAGTKTLYIVASKSGTTIESATLFAYFCDTVKSAAGEAGKHFIAITDPDTLMAKTAAEKKFREVFVNPADVGGRYSALTFFGLVPAALAGVNIQTLAERALEEKRNIFGDAPAASKKAALLGAAMAVLASEGRDKVTIVTNETWSAFGDWAEQLIA
ncbi:MAG: transaldolase, partial [Candidatus Omnitrophica bacterium]|nr:transaldolase [Candidatus Omnitrophota bacterium]